MKIFQEQNEGLWDFPECLPNVRPITDLRVKSHNFAYFHVGFPPNIMSRDMTGCHRCQGVGEGLRVTREMGFGFWMVASTCQSQTKIMLHFNIMSIMGSCSVNKEGMTGPRLCWTVITVIKLLHCWSLDSNRLPSEVNIYSYILSLPWANPEHDDEWSWVSPTDLCKTWAIFLIPRWNTTVECFPWVMLCSRKGVFSCRVKSFQEAWQWML